MPTFGSLFAGIGGIDLGLERAGWTGRWQVEWDPFCQRVLAKHWPDVTRYGDITTVDWGTVERVDLLAGGFPCQPFSVAGRQQRMDDDRWLWPEFARAIRALRPRLVLVENVPGLLVGGGMDRVLGDLAELGYDAEWDSIPASAVGAPHLRYRVWILAYASRDGRDRSSERHGQSPEWEREAPRRHDPSRCPDPDREYADAGVWTLADPDGAGSQGRPIQPERPDQRPPGPSGLADPDGGRWNGRTGQFGPGRWGQPADGGQWRTEPEVGRVAHGVPARVDRLRSLGNAVVPQVVEVIGRRLMEALA